MTRAIGLPVTEAYLDGNTRTQIIEHLQLELHGTTVTVANLGAEVLTDRVLQGDPVLAPYPNGGTMAPVPATSSRFP